MSGGSKGIYPTHFSIEPNRLSVDLNQVGDPAIDEAVQLRQGVAQIHSRLRVVQPIPQQSSKTVTRNAIAISET